MLNIRQLQVFISVAKVRNFTKAAAQLYMTQPAISWQIKSLEKDLGVQLLERRDRSILLTNAGQVLFDHAKKIVDNYDEAIVAIEEVKGFQRGNLVIGASTIPGEYILPRLIGGFKQQYPGINISLDIADTAKIIEGILLDEVHLAVSGAKTENNRLSFEPIIQDELILIVPPGHQLTKQACVKLNHLTQIPFVMRESGSGTRQVFEEHWLTSGLTHEQMSVVMELGSTRAVITAVEAGLGVSMVSHWAAEEALSLGRVCKVPMHNYSFQRHLYVVTRKDREIGTLTGMFHNFLADQQIISTLLPKQKY